VGTDESRGGKKKKEDIKEKNWDVFARASPRLTCSKKRKNTRKGGRTLPRGEKWYKGVSADSDRRR